MTYRVKDRYKQEVILRAKGLLPDEDSARELDGEEEEDGESQG